MVRSLLCALLFGLISAVGSTTSGQDRHPMWKYPPELPGAKVETYKNIGETKLQAWIFQPKEAKPTDSRPAIVFYFGGGWRGGTPGQFYPHCRYLASRGMVAITVDYRVRSRQQVLAPACVADAKSAIRWVRANAKRLGIDPNRVVAAGGSAGGHLAACTGIVKGFDDPADDLSISAIPNAMALFNPAVLLSKIDGDQQLDEEKIESLVERTGGKARELSPVLHVRADLPPTIIFHGTADEAVPFWTVERFTRDMTKAGNRCELKAYKNAPHGFFNTGRGGNAERQDNERHRFLSTTFQLDEFLQSLGYLKGPATIVRVTKNANIRLRRSDIGGNYKYSRRRFEQEKKGHVAFIGGSITQMNGYRPMVVSWLKKRFPETEFTFTDAGISSTCSTTGAFRLKRDVLSKGPVDLFFVEFAVNDDQDAAHAEQECIRGMEGIVRQVFRHNRFADIVMTHFVNPSMLEEIQAGELSISQQSHEAVARHYQISTINVGGELADRIAAKTMDWQEYGGTHPKPAGNAMVAEMIGELLATSWSAPLKPGPRLPRLYLQKEPLDPLSYENGRFIPLRSAKITADWKIQKPDWKSIKGSFRSQFAEDDFLEATKPRAELTLDFKGTAIGVYVLAGPDAGILEYSIDGSDFEQTDLFHHYSKGLHYPRTVMFSNELEGGEHTLRLRISADHNEASTGTAARIMQFVAN